jgi:hypothetical protein
MSDEQRNYQYSIVCQTHDRAVLFCLRALCEFADGRFDGGALPSTSSAASGTGPDDWSESGGQFTLRFSDSRDRATFLGEATRLLPGKWLRLGMSDVDAGPR